MERCGHVGGCQHLPTDKAACVVHPVDNEAGAAGGGVERSAGISIITTRVAVGTKGDAVPPEPAGVSWAMLRPGPCAVCK